MLIYLVISFLGFFLLAGMQMNLQLNQLGERHSLSPRSAIFLFVNIGILFSIIGLSLAVFKLGHTYFPAQYFGLCMVAAVIICGGILYVLILLAYHMFTNRSIGQTRFVFRELVAETSNPIHVDSNAGLDYLGLNSQAAKENAELLENAIGLFSIEIRECLIPRNEIVAIELSESFESIKNTFVESKHSKLIVFENDIDKIIGYVHHSDFYEEKTELSKLVREIPAVPESMSAVEMLTFFKKKQKSIAWVVDEFGGTAGILTTEDLLEELFGEIEDEHDQSEYIEQQISAEEFILSGRLEVEYINDKFELEIPTESAETLSGYIIEVHNEIPEKDEKIIIDSYEYKILQVSKTRIETIRLKIIEE